MDSLGASRPCHGGRQSAAARAAAAGHNICGLYAKLELESRPIRIPQRSGSWGGESCYPVGIVDAKIEFRTLAAKEDAFVSGA